MSSPIGDTLEREWHDTTPAAPTGYRQQQTPEGDTVSLTSMLDNAEQRVAAAVHDAASTALAELRNAAGWLDQEPIVQTAASLAGDIAPEVRAAAADLLPLITALPLPLIGALKPLIAALAHTPAAPPATTITAAPVPDPAAADPTPVQPAQA